MPKRINTGKKKKVMVRIAAGVIKSSGLIIRRNRSLYDTRAGAGAADTAVVVMSASYFRKNSVGDWRRERLPRAPRSG
jgi:hypothetical protein